MSAARRRRKAIERRQNVAYLFPQPGERPMSPFIRNLLGLGILEGAWAAQQRVIRDLDHDGRVRGLRLGRIADFSAPLLEPGSHWFRTNPPQREHGPLAHYSVDAEGLVTVQTDGKTVVAYDPARPLTPEDLTND